MQIRDRHASCSLGRPMRIHDDDCDVEMLEESDFEDDKYDGRASDITTRELSIYVIQMTKLTVIRKFFVSKTRVISAICITDFRRSWKYYKEWVSLEGKLRCRVNKGFSNG